MTRTIQDIKAIPPESSPENIQALNHHQRTYLLKKKRQSTSMSLTPQTLQPSRVMLSPPQLSTGMRARTQCLNLISNFRHLHYIEETTLTTNHPPITAPPATRSLVNQHILLYSNTTKPKPLERETFQLTRIAKVMVLGVIADAVWTSMYPQEKPR